MRIRAAVLAAVVTTSSVACSSPREEAEGFPPISCSLTDDEGVEHSGTVRVGDQPVEVSANGGTLEVSYRPTDEGRSLRVVFADADGGPRHSVHYVIPGRQSLRNQFGQGRDALTGLHRVPTDDGDVSWSCAVLGGEAEE